MSETSLSKAGFSLPPVGERENLYASLGPGLITGAADDDPSGIATYSQVGAQFGFAMLWTMLFSFPLMAAIQEICSRLGRITGMGVAANLAKCYPKTVVRGLVFLLCVATIVNLGADVAAMAAVLAVRLRMQVRNCLAGGQAWRTSRATRESFTTFFPGPPFLACA